MASGVFVNWIPVSVAAKMLKVSRQRVYELVALGEIGWQKLGNTILISKESVRRRIERRLA
jgi:excisionase family DNA binding protein